jgi:hypothetical protein
MAGELTSAAQEFFAALDAKDVDRLTGRFADDAQGVDEISRRWIRGRNEVESYLRQLLDAVSDVRTELRDPQERVWGEAGVVTCWIEPGLHVGRRVAAHLGSDDDRLPQRCRRVEGGAVPLDPTPRADVTTPGPGARRGRDACGASPGPYLVVTRSPKERTSRPRVCRRDQRGRRRGAIEMLRGLLALCPYVSAGTITLHKRSNPLARSGCGPIAGGDVRG